MDKYADFIVTAVSTAVAKVIPTSESRHPKSQPVSEESPAYIHTYLHIYTGYPLSAQQAGLPGGPNTIS